VLPIRGLRVKNQFPSSSIAVPDHTPTRNVHKICSILEA